MQATADPFARMISALDRAEAQESQRREIRQRKSGEEERRREVRERNPIGVIVAKDARLQEKRYASHLFETPWE